MMASTNTRLTGNRKVKRASPHSIHSYYVLLAFITFCNGPTESFFMPHRYQPQHQHQPKKKRTNVQHSYSHMSPSFPGTFQSLCMPSKHGITLRYEKDMSTSSLLSTGAPSFSSASSSEKRHGNHGTNTRYSKPHHVRIKKQKWRSNKDKTSPAEIKRRLQNARDVENKLERALEGTRELIRLQRFSGSESNYHDNQDLVISFPSVRECNSALAILGDTNDFKRALRLFRQMRKSQMLVSVYNTNNDKNDTGNRMYLFPPSPSLVTYSTLMSRAVSLGKQRVALRLWRLMISQKQFFTNIHDKDSSSSNSRFGAPIVPDIKAVNILMNVYAKMADNESAKMLMEQLYQGNVERYYPMKHQNNNDQNDSKISALASSSSFISSKNNSSTSFPKTRRDLSLEEVKYLIRVVPKLKANIVTYNTLIDACHRAGDLDAGKKYKVIF